MNDKEREPEHACQFSSEDSVLIIDDGPGDTTIRPARLVLQKLAEIEREKIRRWRDRLQQGDTPEP